MRFYASIEDARLAFEPFARLEPNLWGLWDLCRRAAPPTHQRDPVVDEFDVDPYELDPLAADKPDDGWCAEDYFRENVKSKLLVLVGLHRTREPHELATRKAYDTVYDILLNYALARLCACCADTERDDNELWLDGDGDRPAHW